MFYQRPKIKPTPTKLDIALDGTSLVILLFLWIYTIIAYSKLPAIIPAHYGFDGKVDRYGSKMLVLLLPGIVTLVFIVLTILNRHPHIFNYPKTITEENALQQYTMSTRLLRIIKLVIVMAFSFVEYKIVNYNDAANTRLEWWFIPGLLIALLAPTFYFVYRSFKKKAE